MKRKRRGHTHKTLIHELAAPSLLDPHCAMPCCAVLQLRVIAYDSASPSRSATATVDIRVGRNPAAPVFTRSVYEQTIAETYALGAVVEQIIANDTDGVGTGCGLSVGSG